MRMAGASWFKEWVMPKACQGSSEPLELKFTLKRQELWTTPYNQIYQDSRWLTWTNATLLTEETSSRPPYSLSVLWNSYEREFIAKQNNGLWITRIPLLRSPGVNFDPKTSEHIFVNSSVKVGDESKKTDVKHNITQGKSWSKRMALLRGRLIPSKLCACLVKPWPRKIVQWLRDDIPHQNELMFEN